MGIRVFKPTSPARRFQTCSDFADVTTDKPLRKLVEAQSKSGGRNHFGRITTRFRGGGHKRRYRVIDFRRSKIGVPAKVAHIEYDPNRSARIALLHYADGEKRYIIAPEGIKQGDVIETGAQADIKPGNNLPLRNIPTGTVVHAIELRPLGGAKIARSAGAAVQLVAKDGAYAQLRMPSGEIRNVDARCRATVGEVGNSDHANIQLGKAGLVAELHGGEVQEGQLHGALQLVDPVGGEEDVADMRIDARGSEDNALDPALFEGGDQV